MRRWMKQIMVWLICGSVRFCCGACDLQMECTAFGLFMQNGHDKWSRGSWWPAWDFFQQKERVRFSTESVRRHVCSA